jgi:Fe-S cluster assembly protein SufD
MNAPAAGNTAQSFLARFAGLRDRLPGDAAPRDAAAARLREGGLPGPRDEAWKYTSLRPLADISFHEAFTDAGDHRAAPPLPDLGALAGLPRLVFVDGRYRGDLSIQPDGFTARCFTDAPVLTNHADRGAIVTLNTLLAEDGAVLDIPAGRDAGTLLLINLGADLAGHPAAFHPRHTLRLAAGAALTLVDISAGRGTYLQNPVLDIDLAEEARLTHLRLQLESAEAFHLAAIYARIAARASYDSFSLTLGGRLTRCEMHARLTGEGGHAALNAAQILGGHQHADFTTVVSHDAPSCTSRQTVKNVLEGQSRGVFQGKIEVARTAQKTDGYQMNQALLLSPLAEIDSKPQLEIYADDVKCSHGATVGELDAEQLFYLTSRGIARDEARAMLVRAFLAEALDMIPHRAARALFEAALDRRWSQGA